ncbi:MAG: transglycosylase domain-containing protein [Anaerolineae bacterium]|nr:transglycosylase domain-containing protein [Anaerolineae bacterium]
MADRPNNNPTPNEPQYTGGWHAPSGNARRTPVRASQPPSQSGWKVVNKLPENLAAAPTTAGGWHLPSPNDTTVEPDEKMKLDPERIQAAESFRPEDMLFLSDTETADSVDAVRPEEALSAAIGLVDSEADTRIEPMMADTESANAIPLPLLEFEKAEELTSDSSDLLNLEDKESDLPAVADADDESAFSMSELIALQSLVEQAPPASVVPTSPSATGRDAASGTGAQPAVEATGAQPAADDAAAFAKQKLQELGLSGTGAAAPVSPAVSSTAADDPAAVARQKLEELGLSGTGAAAPVSSTAAQPAMSQDLATRFRTTEASVRALRDAHRNGQMSREQLQEELRKLMILDEQNVWWMMGVETDTWYRFENNEWIVATPPYGDIGQPARGAPPTVTSGLDPNEVVGGSLPYFPTGESPAQASVFNQSSVEFGAPLETGGFSPTEQMDLPRSDTPVQDPDQTMVGAAGAYLDPYRRDQAPTIQNLRYTPETLVNPAVADPYGDYPATPAPIQGDAYVTAPAYDLDSAESPIYAGASARERERTISTVLRLALVGIGAVVLLAACGLGFVLTQYNSLASEYLDDVAALANYKPGFQTAKILDVNGDLIAELNSQDGGARTTVPLDRISPFMVHAVVSLENERFFDDPGWDWIAIGRAVVQNTAAGQVESGASTITQQIAEQLVLRQSTTTPDLKLREIVIAAEIAKQYSKEFILQLYLNEIFFGNQSYGVEAAAQFYFGVSANDLNLPQSALLAGMIAAPATYNPVQAGDEDLATYNQRRDAVFQRMEVVMARMQEVGCLPIPGQPTGGFCVDANVVRQAAIDQARVKAAKYEPRDVEFKYPHFVQFVSAQVERLFGTGEMFRRGFVIRTTLNPAVQDAAESALDQTMAALIATGVNTGSVMAVDPRTGAIRGMVGSPDFNNVGINGQVNGALTFQQPGSAIKPIVYTGALEGADANGDGILDYLTPASILWDVPTTFPNTNPPYAPVNFDRQFHGPQAVRYALQNSYNIPAIKTYQFIGETKFRDVAGRLGLSFPENAVFGLPTGIGATEVTLYSMMQAFGTLANNGVRAPLYAIESVTDANGTPAQLPERPTSQAIQPQIAYVISNILSDDPARGLAFPTNGWLTINGLPTSNVVAAKTGTTDGARDLWTMGYTRNAVVGVWLGRPDNNTTLVQDGGYGSAAPLWNRVMSTMLGTMPRPEGFANPGGVVQAQICATTGTLPAANCPSLRTELFLQSQPPPGADQSFVRNIEVDTWTGLLANEYCPDNRESATIINITDASAVAWLNSPAGASTAAQLGITSATIANPPTATCDLNTEVPIARIISPTDGQPISGTVQITGAATAGTFNRFQLDYAPSCTSAAGTPITGAITTPQTSGILGTWNTIGVANGTYALRLQMFSNNSYGGNLQRCVTIAVNNIVQPTPPPVVVPTNNPFVQPTFPFVEITPTQLPFDEVTPGP